MNLTPPPKNNKKKDLKIKIKVDSVMLLLCIFKFKPSALVKVLNFFQLSDSGELTPKMLDVCVSHHFQEQL